jgi:hypothetical protein
MKRRAPTWRELARRLPYAGLPYALFGTRFRIEEMKDWREQEKTAGRPSGLEDFYLQHGLCWPCRSRLQSGCGGDGRKFAAIRGMRSLRGHRRKDQPDG